MPPKWSGDPEDLPVALISSGTRPFQDDGYVGLERVMRTMESTMKALTPGEEHTRRVAVSKYGVTHGEFGWVLDDNQGMMSIAQLPGADINHRYRIYEKELA